MNAIKHPEITVALSEEDGNIYFIIGRARSAMRKAGISRKECDQFSNEVAETKSYDEALQVVMRWVGTI